LQNIDTLLAQGLLTKRERIKRYDISWSLTYGEHIEDRIETDDVPFTNASDGTSYHDAVINSGALHYYRLNEASGTTLLDATGHRNGTYSSDVSDSGWTMGSALYTDTDLAKRMSDTRSAHAGPNGSSFWGTPGTYTEFSLEFWFKPTTNSSDLDGVLGFRSPGGAGVTIGYQSNQLRFRRYALSAPTIDYDMGGFQLTNNQWHHVVYTLSTDNKLITYVNGHIVANQDVTNPNPGVRGFQVPNEATSNIMIGHVSYSDYANLPGSGFDEIALYQRVLTPSEVSNHYRAAVSGAGLTVGDADASAPFVADRTLPVLLNEQDITDMVERWSINRDAQNTVSSGNIVLRDGWFTNEAKKILQAGTYITIEIGYSIPGTETDTGWIQLAHMISQGPVRGKEGANAEASYNCPLAGILSLLSHDLVNYNLTPDIIKVPRTQAVRVYSDLDVTKFMLARTGTSDYLYNWADKPSVRIWTTQFQNRGTYDPAYSDVMPVKSANGSIQVVGGTGEVIFNTNYLRDKISNNGLGDPLRVDLQIERFAVAEDVRFGHAIGTTTTYSGGKPIKAVINMSSYIAAPSLADGWEGRTIFIRSGPEKGEMFVIVSIDVTSYGSTGNWGIVVKTIDKSIPDLDSAYQIYDGTTPTLIQLTDPNFVEDAVWKILYRNGFQQKDPTKPFYVKIDPPLTREQLPPLNYTYMDSIKDIDLLQEVLNYAPPNYYIFEAPYGFVETRTVVQSPLGQWDHDLTLSWEDHSEDASSYGVYTRVIQEGEGTRNFNIALHKDSGGYSICGSYKLDDVTRWGTQTQDQMDAIVQQVIDADPRSPQVNSGPYWYGRMYDKNPATQGVTFTDVDLMWIDLGRNSISGNPWLIDAFDIISFKPYKQTNIVPMSIRVYSMTEEDYVSVTGHLPKAIPGHADDSVLPSNMRSLQDAYQWKLMLDETVVEDGQKTIESSEFIDGKPVFTRFLKIQIAQPWYLVTDKPNNGQASIVMSGFKAWLSRKIVRTAELGVDGQYTSYTWVDKAKRLRRRSVALEKNVALDSSTACKQFALAQLQELASEFEAQSFSAVAVLADIHDTVRWVAPYTGSERNLVVRSVEIQGGNVESTRNLVCVDYSTVGA